MTEMDRLNAVYEERLRGIRDAIGEGRAYLRGRRIIRFNNWSGFAMVEDGSLRRSMPVGKGLEALGSIQIR